jgi:hypothetical protein
VTLVVLVGGLSPASVDAAKAGRCPSGQVRRTIDYVHHKGGPVDHATGCVAKTVVVPTSFAGLQHRIRALGLTFAPARVVRAFRTAAARRLAATDGRTDALLAADVAAHAARATRDDNTQTNDNGTQTLHSESHESLDTADDTGEAYVTTSSTKSTRVRGTAIRKRLQVRYLINRCPDASGKSQGSLSMTLRDVRTSNGVSISETSTFNADIVVQFDDKAQVASVKVTGTWSFAVDTAHSHRSVGGEVSSSDFRITDGAVYINLPTSVTTGTDDAIASGGGPLGVWVAEIVAKDTIEKLIGKARGFPLSGGCVKIVPESPTVHVRAGGTVDIVAHLTDHHDQTFAGPMTAVNVAGRVAPTATQASNDARFTYAAPSEAKAGDTDVVQLGHLSKRGKALPNSGTVNVVVDAGRFPKRFDGSWTRIMTLGPVTETVQGTASYVRDQNFPESVEGQTSIPYNVLSASVTWTVTGAGCSGSGVDDATNNDALGATDLTLEDVTANPAAPRPEPHPFYYSIRASGNPQSAPIYTCPGPSTSVIDVMFLDIGHPGPFTSAVALDKVQRSDSITVLQGHATSTDTAITYDDTWHFTGSG